MQRFTNDEQIRLVCGASFFGTAEIPEKNVQRLQLLDGGTGINFEQLFGDFLSHAGRTGIGGDALRNVLRYFYTPEQLPDDESRKLHAWITEKLRERFPEMTPPGCYPSGILLGSCWNPEVIEQMGRALGMEAHAYGVNVLLGTPNVNLHRDIRNGRLFEGYSEDPYLVSALAPALVRGVQSRGVAANVKHFASNHQETNRMNINELIPERALHELYFPAFHACVDAGVATVMSAYNQINGIPCTENRAMLHDMLREEWGFEGVVMSDWNAVYHPEKAVNAGNDLAMPANPAIPETLSRALETNALSAESLRISAERVAALSEKYARPAEGSISLAETDKAAYDAAAEGIVLLKNDSAVLPLDPSARIALYGAHAESLLTCGEGSAGILTTRNVSLHTALSQRFASVSMHDMENADTLVYVYSLPGQEGHDRRDISLSAQVTGEWERLLADADSRGMKKILILNVSAPVALDGWEERFDAIFCIFLPGMQGANALADCLCGNVNPSGKLPLTWPARLEDLPAYLNFPGDGMQVHYGEGIFVGYRWYDARRIRPLYPFGHGLSYTEFAIENLTADKETFSDSVNVTVTVANLGNRSGKTVVQFYVSDPQSTLTKPCKELKAFRKLALTPQERKTITVTLPRHAFESYDPDLHAWTMEEGWYGISAGFSSGDLRADCKVYADVTSPYTFGIGTSVKTIMEHEELRSILDAFFKEHNLPWSAMLTSYEYTAQDTLELILTQTGCPQDCREMLSARMRSVKKQ